MSPMRAVLLIGLLILAASCAAPAASQEASDPGALSSEGAPSEPGAVTSTPAEPSTAAASEGGLPGIPDDAELARRYDCILEDLAPPGGTEVARENPGPLDLGIFFESTESFESLEAFYAEAIPAAGFTIIEERTDFPGSHEWLFTSGEEFQPFISLEGDVSGQGGGSSVGMGLLGIPPDC
jgi:hypothetical protein